VTGPLVSVDWLREHLGDPVLRVVDCRFRLGEPGAGEALWRAGHIPGAAFLDLDGDLSSAPGSPPLRGRHPLPEPADFEAAARRTGIGPETFVVAYDEASEGGAARLWWLLRHFGHERVAVLDGGLHAWRDQGGPLSAAAEPPGDVEPPGDTEPPGRAKPPGRTEPPAAAPFIARARRDDIRALEELAEELPARLLLDARAPERYRGEHEPIDPVAGHIPGAVNLPFAELAPDGRLLDPADLRARFEAAGAVAGRELVAYCGSGVTACVLVLAAEHAGLDPVRLYPGSWSEWSGRGLPAARH
jgi:thiosulfate/3-mercaptopyruvate sulfurtransferase